MLAPTFRVAHVPAAEPVFTVTVSPLNTPTGGEPPVFRVPAVVALYTLLSAVTPVTVSPNGLTVSPPARVPELLPNTPLPVNTARIVCAAGLVTLSWVEVVVYVQTEVVAVVLWRV